MKIRERRSGDVVILEFSGRLAIGDGDSQAGERIAALLAAGERNRVELRTERVVRDRRYGSKQKQAEAG